MSFVYGCAVIVGVFMLFDDWYHRTIRLWMVLAFAIASFAAGWSRFAEASWWGVVILIVLSLSLGVGGLSIFKSRPVIGGVDFIMIGLLLLWLNPNQVPSFLIFSGIIMAFYGATYPHQEIPLIPGLIISWMVLMVLEGDVVTRYIKLMSDYLIEYICAFWPTAFATQ